MNFRQIDESPKTFVLVFQSGDEVAEGLLRFAKEQKLSAASFTAIGAASSVRSGGSVGKARDMSVRDIR